MKDTSSSQVSSVITALLFAAGLSVTAPDISAQGTLNVSETMFDDFSDISSEPTLFQSDLGEGVNTITERTDVFSKYAQPYGKDFDCFQVFNPQSLGIESISVTIFSCTSARQMMGGTLQLLDHAIATFALSGGAEMRFTSP